MPRKVPAHIPVSDLVARFVLYPAFFTADVFDRSNMFQFTNSGEESGVWRREAPTDLDVHRRGCKKARLKNKRTSEAYAARIAEGKNPQKPVTEYYCGFLEAERGALEIQTDFARVELA